MVKLFIDNLDLVYKMKFWFKRVLVVTRDRNSRYLGIH